MDQYDINNKLSASSPRDALQIVAALQDADAASQPELFL